MTNVIEGKLYHDWYLSKDEIDDASKPVWARNLGGGGPLADWQIEERQLLPDWHPQRLLVDPYAPATKVEGRVSFGLSSYGIDLRLGRNYMIFNDVLMQEVDPLTLAATIKDRITKGQFFLHNDVDRCVIPPNSFCLAESMEKMRVPGDCIVFMIGKSTYARCGINLPMTPLEPCLSADTETLTSSGWVLLSDVKVGDKVLTRRSDGVAEFREVERKQEYRYSGNLMWFDGRSVDQMVTPDHKVFVWPFRKSQPCLLPAADVFGRWNFRFDRRVDWRGEDFCRDISFGERSYPLADFSELYGCWLGDGSAFRGTDGGYHIKLAVVTNDRKREDFRRVLGVLGIKAREHERGFEWYDKSLCSFLSPHGHAGQKRIDRRFLGCSPATLSRLVAGLIESDGNQETQTFTTTSPGLADDAQEAAYKAGVAAIVRRVSDSIAGRTIEAYKVRMCDDHVRPKMSPLNHKLVPYDGMVYDVTVPNHVFFVRRDGKASWTGNCWRGIVTIEIANSTRLPAVVHSNQGIGQAVFLKGSYLCRQNYDQKAGRSYQDQTGLTLPRA